MGDEEIDQAVRRVLNGLGAAYEMVPCDPALADTDAFCQAYGYSLRDSANTIVVAGKAQPPLLRRLRRARRHPFGREPDRQAAPRRPPGVIRLGRGDRRAHRE